ncbi:MAG: hypothetical protein V3R66_04575 [Rhodospirillales bacterium]
MPDEVNVIIAASVNRRNNDERRVVFFKVDIDRRVNGERRQGEERRTYNRDEMIPHHVELIATISWLEEHCKGKWRIGLDEPGSYHAPVKYNLEFSDEADMETFVLWGNLTRLLKEP